MRREEGRGITPPLFFSGAEKADGSGGEKDIRCGLCPRRCLLPHGKAGKCGVRRNRNGKPELPFYGFVTALGLDPIEKKPLYHYRPGVNILSAGFTGCNLHCPFCQNWLISQDTSTPGRFYSPEELIAAVPVPGSSGPHRETAALRAGQIAYTYSEPLVHIEYLLDCMREARRAGIANVLVSNGCVNDEAAAAILDLTDAANIDLKSFSGETYSGVLGGNLSAVRGFIQRAAEKGVHLELTTLVTPGLNDSAAELDKCRDFIAELETGGSAVPWHLSACRPDWKWSGAATERTALVSAAKRAREKLRFVYAGNIVPPAEDFNDTPCAHCGNVLIRRRGFTVNVSGLSLRTENESPAYFCSRCGKAAPVRW